MRIDLLSTNHGSIIAIVAETRRGLTWLRAHVPDARRVARGEPLYCEPACGVAILTGAIADGLHLQDAPSGRVAGGDA